MNTRPLAHLAVTLILALCVASASHAGAQTACDAGMTDHERYPSPLLEHGLDRLMTGICCAASAAGECGQLELAAAEDLMAAQLRSAAGGLRLAGNGKRLVESLYTAQAAWEHYRDSQCTLRIRYGAGDIEQQTASRDRCRFEFTVERILDLARIQEDIEATVRRAAQLY